MPAVRGRVDQPAGPGRRRSRRFPAQRSPCRRDGGSWCGSNRSRSSASRSSASITSSAEHSRVAAPAGPAGAAGSWRRTRPRSRTVRWGARGSRSSVDPRDRTPARRPDGGARAPTPSSASVSGRPAPSSIHSSTRWLGFSSETASTCGHRDRIGVAQPRESARLRGEELRRRAGMGLGEHPATVGERRARTRPRRLRPAPGATRTIATPIARSSVERSRSFMAGSLGTPSSGPVPCGHVRAGSGRGRGRRLGVPAARRFVGVQQRRAGRRRRDLAARRHALRPAAHPRHARLDAPDHGPCADRDRREHPRQRRPLLRQPAGPRRAHHRVRRGGRRDGRRPPAVAARVQAARHRRGRQRARRRRVRTVPVRRHRVGAADRHVLRAR